VDYGAYASSSETFWSDNGSAGLRTLASLESPRSLEKKTTDHEHSTPFYRDYNDITVMTWPFFAKCSKDVVLFLKKKSISPHTLNMYAIYIYKKPLHIFVLGLKLYRKVKKIKKKKRSY
jgi:hypothetical protein